MRLQLPPAIEKKVLIKNRHCCCICQKDGYGKEVWIHHIDGNNSNNVLSNLAVLCVSPHASQADAGLVPGKVGSGKKLSPDEVREFKKIWERKIEEENKIKTQNIPIQNRKQIEILYVFEINKIKNEILSYEGKSNFIKEKFNYLDQLVLEELISGARIRKILIKAYDEMSYQLIGQSEKTKKLAKSIWGLFLHLVGPEHVKINQQDITIFRKGIDTIETLGSFTAEFNDDISSLKAVCSIIYDLGMIAHWYSLHKEKNKILRILNNIKKAALEYEKSGINQNKARVTRIKIIDSTIKKLKKDYKIKT